MEKKNKTEKKTKIPYSASVKCKKRKVRINSDNLGPDWRNPDKHRKIQINSDKSRESKYLIIYVDSRFYNLSSNKCI